MLHCFLLCSHIGRVVVDLAWPHTADNKLKQGVRYTMAMTSDQIQAKLTNAPGQEQIDPPGPATVTVLVTSALQAAVSNAQYSATTR
jgi:hypothetical protein